MVTIAREIKTFLFPFFLTDWHLLFALRSPTKLSGRLLLRHRGSECYEALAIGIQIDFDVSHGADEWMPFPIPCGTADQDPVVIEPGRYELWLEDETTAVALGRVYFHYQPSPEPTLEEVAAVRADPTAMRTMAIRLVDSATDNSVAAYCSIDGPSASPPLPDAVWYRALPDEFVDSQGHRLPLRYLRESMHGLLREKFAQRQGVITSRPLYSASDIWAVIEQFAKLLDALPDEQKVQIFIEKNLLLLAPFAGSRIFKKPPILTKYYADFAVLDSKKTLTLIEIERPSLTLFTKTGKTSAELATPFDQVRSWFREIDQDRAAALRCIRDCPPEVNRIQACIIAGRSLPHENEFRARLAADEGERIQFLTYDQLIQRVVDTVRHLGLWTAPSH